MTNDSAGMATQPWEDAEAPDGATVYHPMGAALPCPGCDVANHVLVRVVGVTEWQCAACHNSDPRVPAYRNTRGRRLPRFEPGSKKPDPDLTRYPTMKPISNPVAIGELLESALGAMRVTDE